MNLGTKVYNSILPFSQTWCEQLVVCQTVFSPFVSQKHFGTRTCQKIWLFIVSLSCSLEHIEMCTFKFLQVFAPGMDKDMVCLLAARASRLENQDAIDAAIVGVLADPKEV